MSIGKRKLISREKKSKYLRVLETTHRVVIYPIIISTTYIHEIRRDLKSSSIPITAFPDSRRPIVTLIAPVSSG
jgi:hypothetical protein